MRFSRIIPLVSALALAACGSQNDGPNISNPDGSTSNGATSLFDPAAGVIPFPFDALFVDASGNLSGTINIPNPKGAPFVNDANRQDGFSTVASAFTDFTGKIDFATATEGLIVVDGSTGARLEQGTDYILQTSTALDDAFGTPINSFRTRILIEPLKPLKQSTTYVVAVTSALKSTDGISLVPNAAFKIVSNSSKTVSEQASDPTSLDTYTYLQRLTSVQRATLEALRARIIVPTVQKLGMLSIPAADTSLVIAWPFTTQSINSTLTAVNSSATAKTLALQQGSSLKDPTAATDAPAIGSIYIGKLIDLPYYLTNHATRTESDTPLTTYWKNNGVPSSGNFAPLPSVPCAAFSPLAPANTGIARGNVDSTTACFPTPKKLTDETIPVIATVPNTAGCATGMPPSGWPVVIFQHGITGNRTQMLAIAPALAKGCMITMAIDLPLHGLLPPADMSNLTATDQVYLATAGIERTFNLDSMGRGPGMEGYTSPAPSGTHFINLSSVITSRDNLRQAVSDLITLTKSIPGAMFLNATGTAPTGVLIDSSKIYFVGHSLGGIVGGTLLGVNNEIKAATLAMPGGGIAKLLDASASFSPVISAGLAAKGVTKGTDTYETFLRFAQTLVDSGDPINYAVQARNHHPIHMIEVLGGSSSTSLPDQVVPNNALTGSLASIPGYLSGTDPLYRIMGLSVIDNLNVPVATSDLKLGANLGYVVRFTAGDHGSILSPAASLAATQEMQRQTVNFLASGGTCLPIGQNCPIP